MSLSIVVPTITGREESLQRTLDAYADTTTVDYEMIVPKDLKNWPAACNAGFRDAQHDFIHFGADDLVPLPGWHDDAIELLDKWDELPAAFVWDHVFDGEPNNVADGKPDETTHFTRVPFMRRDQFDRIGFWPQIDYYADVWLSEKARVLGIETRLVGSYRFVHHWHQHGRLDDDERLAKAWGKLKVLRTSMV